MKVLKFNEFINENLKLRKKLPDEPDKYNLTLYHATSIENWNLIKKNGLVPGFKDPLGQVWKGKYSGKGIYFHQELPIWELKNGNDIKQNKLYMIVLKVEISDNPIYFVPDEEVSTDLNYTPKAIKNKEAIVYLKKIKPKYIKSIIVPKINDAIDWVVKNHGNFDYQIIKV